MSKYSVSISGGSLDELVDNTAAMLEALTTTNAKMATNKPKPKAAPVDEDEDEDDAPVAKKPVKKPAKAESVFDEEDEDEDDAPAPKKSVAKAPAKKSKSDSVFDDDDEDEDEDDAPVKKSAKAAPIKAKSKKDPRVEVMGLMKEIHESRGDEGLQEVKEILTDEFKVKKQSELKDSQVPLFIDRLKEHFDM